MRSNNNHIFCTDKAEYNSGGISADKTVGNNIKCFVRVNDLEVETMPDHIFRIAIYRPKRTSDNTLNTIPSFLPTKTIYKKEGRLALTSSRNLDPCWLIFDSESSPFNNHKPKMSIINWRIK